MRRIASNTIVINTLLILVHLIEVCIHAAFILEVLVTGWTIKVLIRTEMDIMHVSLQDVLPGELLSAIVPRALIRLLPRVGAPLVCHQFFLSYVLCRSRESGRDAPP